MMIVYRENDLWKLNFLVLRRSVSILSGVVGLVFLLWPLSCVPNYWNGEVEQALVKARIMLHGVLPAGVVLPAMLLLSVWSDPADKELLYSIIRVRKPVRMECFWCLRFYLMICVIPVLIVGDLLDFSAGEYMRFAVEVLFVTEVFYLLQVLAHSVIVSGLIVWSYLLFCIMFGPNDTTKNICLIRPYLSWTEMKLRDWIPLVLIMLLLWLLGKNIETQFIYE